MQLKTQYVNDISGLIEKKELRTHYAKLSRKLRGKKLHILVFNEECNIANFVQSLFQTPFVLSVTINSLKLLEKPNFCISFPCMALKLNNWQSGLKLTN